MQQRTLGSLKVSAIGYGAMGLSHAYGAPLEEKEAVTLLRQVYDLGITFFDTAEVYGPYHNENLVGKALRDVKDKVVIATKGGVTLSEVTRGTPIANNDLKVLRQSLEGSLKRLNTDCIDLYYIHRIDNRYSPEETAQTMADFIKEGKIKTYGLSEAPLDYILRAHKVCPVTAIQNRYSLMYTDNEAMFETLKKLNIGFAAFSPLANGLLSLAYSADSVFDAAYDYRSSMPQYQKESFEQNRALFALLREYAQKYSCTAAQLSLSYLMASSDIVVPIPGSRRLERIKENAAAADIVMTKEDHDALSEALKHTDMSALFGVKKG